MSAPTKPGLYYYKVQGSQAWRLDRVWHWPGMKKLWCGRGTNAQGAIPVEQRLAEWRGPLPEPEELPGL